LRWLYSEFRLVDDKPTLMAKEKLGKCVVCFKFIKTKANIKEVHQRLYASIKMGIIFDENNYFVKTGIIAHISGQSTCKFDSSHGK